MVGVVRGRLAATLTFAVGSEPWPGNTASAWAVKPSGIRHLDIEPIAATGDKLDDLASVVAQRRAKLADALEQAVLADMNVRPERLHQLGLAENTAGVGSEQPKHFEGFQPKPDRPAIGPAQLGALLIQFEPGKTKYHSSAAPGR